MGFFLLFVWGFPGFSLAFSPLLSYNKGKLGGIVMKRQHRFALVVLLLCLFCLSACQQKRARFLSVAFQRKQRRFLFPGGVPAP